MLSFKHNCTEKFPETLQLSKLSQEDSDPPSLKSDDSDSTLSGVRDSSDEKSCVIIANKKDNLKN